MGTHARTAQLRAGGALTASASVSSCGHILNPTRSGPTPEILHERNPLCLELPALLALSPHCPHITTHLCILALYHALPMTSLPCLAYIQVQQVTPQLTDSTPFPLSFPGATWQHALYVIPAFCSESSSSLLNGARDIEQPRGLLPFQIHSFLPQLSLSATQQAALFPCSETAVRINVVKALGCILLYTHLKTYMEIPLQDRYLLYRRIFCRKHFNSKPWVHLKWAAVHIYIFQEQTIYVRRGVPSPCPCPRVTKVECQCLTQHKLLCRQPQPSSLASVAIQCSWPVSWSLKPTKKRG